MIRRAFVDLPHGQMHVRTIGQGALPDGADALLVLHPSPTSSRQMAGMIADCADLGTVIAPDTPGNGDSEPPPGDQGEVTDLAHALLHLLDARGLDRVRVYGMHTGAAIAAEMALLAPGRIAGLVLDGIADFQGEALAEVLSRYAPRFEADLDGAMLSRVFQFCRDQFLFFPWYAHGKAARRDSGLPPPEVLYGWVVEVLKAHGSYHRNYHAAFRWNARARLPSIGVPTMVTCAANDPLREATTQLAAATGHDFRPMPRFDAADYAARRRALLISSF